MIFEILLYTLITGFVIGALIPLLPEQIWWLRAWTYPRLQIAIINTVLLMILTAVTGLSGGVPKIAGLALVITIAMCLRDIFPFMPFAKKDSPDANSDNFETALSMVIGNVLMDNTQAKGLLHSIESKDPDIVFLVETNAAWRERMTELEARYPHTYLLDLENYNGMLFYAKFPIKSVQERYLVQDHIPSLSIDLDVNGQTVRFYGVHPRPPRPEDDTEDMDTELNIVAAEARDCDYPVIVTGDLNDVGWSSTTRQFLDISELRDPRKGRGMFNTFNAKSFFVRWPLDHILHSDHFAVCAIERLPKFGSDHFPIYARLAFLKSQNSLMRSGN